MDYPSINVVVLIVNFYGSYKNYSLYIYILKGCISKTATNNQPIQTGQHRSQ